MVNVVLNTLVALLVSGATLSFNFKAADVQGNVVYDGEGTIVTVGKNYRMETEDILVVSDGSVKGVYQKKIDEIVLMPVGEDNGEIMDNPFAVLQNPGTSYDITVLGSDSKGIPREMVLKAKNGAVYTLTVKNCSSIPSPDPGLFVLDMQDYPNAVVTDLR